MKEVRFDNYFTSAAFTKSSNSKTVEGNWRTSVELKDINMIEGDIPVMNDVQTQTRYSASLRLTRLLS